MSKHLTPDERAAIVARYEQTANASAVAREFGVDEKSIRKILAASGAPKKSVLHAQACARGVREGRRALTGTARLLQRWLDEHGRPDSPTMEPSDVAKMASSLRGIVQGVIECDEHRSKAKLSRLTRDLRRAEIELARLKIAAGGVEQHAVALTVSDAAAAAAELFGSPSALSNADRKRTDDEP